jgi:hypothetical protein
MIKGRLGELNEHADDEARRMGSTPPRKIVQNLIRSNARETDEGLVREIDKERQAANTINLL